MNDSADSFGMDVTRTGRAVVVTIRGEASMTHAPAILAELECLTLNPEETIVLDVSGLSFIGGEGLDALLSGRELSRLRHHSIRLVNPSGPVRDILKLTRLDQVFPIYETLDEACSA